MISPSARSIPEFQFWAGPRLGRFLKYRIGSRSRNSTTTCSTESVMESSVITTSKSVNVCRHTDSSARRSSSGCSNVGIQTEIKGMAKPCRSRRHGVLVKDQAAEPCSWAPSSSRGHRDRTATAHIPRLYLVFRPECERQFLTLCLVQSPPVKPLFPSRLAQRVDSLAVSSNSPDDCVHLRQHIYTPDDIQPRAQDSCHAGHLWEIGAEFFLLGSFQSTVHRAPISSGN